MTFGQRIRELRQAKGLTQRELANKAGISYAYVSKLETGTMSPPRHKVIQTLARILGATDRETDELFGMAGKIPHDLLGKVDAETIRTLRSLGNAPRAGRRLPARSRKRAAKSSRADVQYARLEEATEQRPETFRALVENSLDGIVIMGPKLEVLYQNPATARTLGYELGDLVGEDVLGLIHPDDMRKTAHRLSRVSQIPGSSDRAHLRVKHKDGTWHAIDVWATNLLQDPAVNGVVIYFRDISGRSGTEGAWAGQTAAILTAKEYHLTQSELRVLALLVDGQSNASVAEQLVISPSTVRFHVTNIIRKLGVSNRTEAAALAVRRHVVS
ncbi:MAG: PAS domain S-box protein [Dehalococcoidia bacterium]|nr:PAS domain S-box protein [Dehalococcoidia bacterium]